MPRQPRRRPSRSVNVRFNLSSKQIRRILLLALILAFVVWVWGRFSLTKIVVSGNRIVQEAQVSKLVDDQLKAPWNRNLLVINTDAIATNLALADPRIETAQVSRTWPHGLSVVLTEREYSLLWKTSDQTFILDNNGTVVAPASDGSLKLQVVTDSTNLPVKVGDKVVPPRFVGFAKDIFAQLPKRTSLKIGEMTVPDTTSEVYVKTDMGLTIKFDTTREASGEVQDLVAVLNQLRGTGKIPVEYVDLRVEHKAYYK